ncbi:hypothetical protein S101413_04537 (plasmid) [Bacillus velezensis]|nr:hypothetical protein S101413_04537 [Bacillus velezensis]
MIFRAPDLALTQLVIETISVACFFFVLPSAENAAEKEDKNIPDDEFIISLGVGVIVTMLGIASSSEKTKTASPPFHRLQP